MPVARSRPFPWKQVGTLAEVAGLLILLIVFVVIISRGLASARPSPDREGLSWGYQELIDHLKARGLVWESRDGSPAARGQDALVVLSREQPCGPDDRPATAFERPWSDLRIVLKKDAREAKDFAGAAGAGSFAWGRFAFYSFNFGRGDMVAEARKILE